MKSTLALGALLLVCVLWSAPAVARSLAIAEAQNLREFPAHSPITISSDGEWIAYVIKDPSRAVRGEDKRQESYVPAIARGSSIWVHHLPTGRSHPLSTDANSWAPSWAPDGQRLAYYSDRDGISRLWIWDRSSSESAPLSDGPAYAAAFHNVVPLWTPDSRSIVFARRRLAHPPASSGEAALAIDAVPPSVPSPNVRVFTAGDESEASEQTGRNQFYSPEHLDRLYAADLVLVNRETGQSRALVSGKRPAGYWLSPDGRYLAYTHAIGYDATPFLHTSLNVVSLDGSIDRLLVPEFVSMYGFNVSWAPDSKRLAYTALTAQSTADEKLSRGDCFVVAIDGEPRLLTPGYHPNFADWYRAPVWDSSGQNVYLLASPRNDIGLPKDQDGIWRASTINFGLTEIVEIEGVSIIDFAAATGGGRLWLTAGANEFVVLATEDNTGLAGFYKIDLAARSHRRLASDALAFGTAITETGNPWSMDVEPNTNALFFTAERADQPANLWQFDFDTARLDQVTDVNPHLASVEFGRSRLVSWTSIDGRRLRGVVLLPAGYEPGVKYPLVVNLYQGVDFSPHANRFGVTSVTPLHLQLLATRGYAVFLPDTPQRAGTPMLDLLKMVMPGIDRVVELGIADEDRLSMMGISNGGRSVLSLLVQTDRFVSAVAVNGYADFIAAIGFLRDDGTSVSSVLWMGDEETYVSPWEDRTQWIENSPFYYLDRVSTPLLLISGAEDTTISPAQSDRVFAALRLLGRKVEYAKYIDEGHFIVQSHNYEDYVNRILRWLETQDFTRSAPKPD